jgi:hypothetical protein
MSPEQQTPVTSQAATKVSSLARRIHGWSWQAVRFPEDGESRYCRCSDPIPPIVSHWNGHWVSSSPNRTPQVPVVDRAPQGPSM